MNCERTIEKYVRELGERFSCKQRGESLWIISPYTYADGDYIEVVVVERRSGKFLVSDMGETLRNLINHGFDPRSTQKGKYLLEEILDRYEVELTRGRLEKRVSLQDVGKTLLDVMCACFATGDLLYLSRAYQPATFTDEVGHWLMENQISFETRYTIEGKISGKKYKVDFFLPKVGNRIGLLQTLSPKVARAIKPMVDSTFRLWSDVANDRWRGTLLDDRLITWRREDTELLKRVSAIHIWSHKEHLLEEIAAR